MGLGSGFTFFGGLFELAFTGFLQMELDNPQDGMQGESREEMNVLVSYGLLRGTFCVGFGRIGVFLCHFFVFLTRSRLLGLSGSICSSSVEYVLADPRGNEVSEDIPSVSGLGLFLSLLFGNRVRAAGGC